MNGSLIYKDEWNKKLSSDPEFLEGGVRLQIELGECYNKNEILVKLLVETGCEKVYKEFIGEELTTLSQLKVFICNELNIKPEEYYVNKTSYLKDPIKVYKNENETLKKLGIKDGNLIYFENISQQLYEKYLVKVFLSGQGKNDDLTFLPLNIETSIPAVELTLSKEETLFDLKQSVIEKLYLSTSVDCNITVNKLRLRVVSKKGEAERILRGNSNPVKKLKIENPCCLLLEELDEDEDLLENTLQLYIFERDSKNSTYLNKKSFLFTYQNTATSDLLYEKIRSTTNLRNITIAKHTKSYYNWEIIAEFENQQPINLKKSSYNIKDGGTK